MGKIQPNNDNDIVKSERQNNDNDIVNHSGEKTIHNVRSANDK